MNNYWFIPALLMALSFSLKSQDIIVNITNASDINVLDGSIFLQVEDVGYNYIKNNPPFTYKWTFPDGNMVTQENDFSGTNTIYGLETGEYCAVISSASGCMTEGCYYVESCGGFPELIAYFSYTVFGTTIFFEDESLVSCGAIETWL